MSIGVFNDNDSIQLVQFKGINKAMTIFERIDAFLKATEKANLHQFATEFLHIMSFFSHARLVPEVALGFIIFNSSYSYDDLHKILKLAAQEPYSLCVLEKNGVKVHENIHTALEKYFSNATNTKSLLYKIIDTMPTILFYDWAEPTGKYVANIQLVAINATLLNNTDLSDKDILSKNIIYANETVLLQTNNSYYKDNWHLHLNSLITKAQKMLKIDIFNTDINDEGHLVDILGYAGEYYLNQGRLEEASSVFKDALLVIDKKKLYLRFDDNYISELINKYETTCEGLLSKSTNNLSCKGYLNKFKNSRATFKANKLFSQSQEAISPGTSADKCSVTHVIANTTVCEKDYQNLDEAQDTQWRNSSAETATILPIVDESTYRIIVGDIFESVCFAIFKVICRGLINFCRSDPNNQKSTNEFNWDEKITYFIFLLFFNYLYFLVFIESKEKGSFQERSSLYLGIYNFIFLLVVQLGIDLIINACKKFVSNKVDVLLPPDCYPRYNLALKFSPIILFSIPYAWQSYHLKGALRTVIYSISGLVTEVVAEVSLESGIKFIKGGNKRSKQDPIEKPQRYLIFKEHIATIQKNSVNEYSWYTVFRQYLSAYLQADPIIASSPKINKLPIILAANPSSHGCQSVKENDVITSEIELLNSAVTNNSIATKSSPSQNNFSRQFVSRTPCSFNFTTKQEIAEFLVNDWEKYTGNYNSLANDNEILQKNIGNILQLSKSDIQNSLQAVRLKALDQILGLDGHAVEAQKLPQKTVDMKDIKTGKTENAITIPDFNDEKIVTFAKWHQLEYLLYNLCFLVECYIQIQKGLIQETALPIISPKLLIALEHEIWITINAYNLRKAYEEIIEEFKKNDDKEKCLKSFSEVNSAFIKAIKDSNEAEFEFCVPSGSIDHAIYVNFIFDKKKQELIIRIDNSSQEEPTVYEPLDMNKAEHNEELNRYLNDIGFALKDKNNAAREIIYNKYDDFSFKIAKNIEYQPFPKQQAPNCVVEGYWRGMWYRFEYIGEGSADKVFKWYFNNLKQFAAISHTTENVKTKHLNLGRNLYDNLAIAKKVSESTRQKDENRDGWKLESKLRSAPPHLSIFNQKNDSNKPPINTRETPAGQTAFTDDTQRIIPKPP